MFLDYSKRSIFAIMALGAVLCGVGTPTMTFAFVGIQEDPTACERGISLSGPQTGLIVDTIPWDIVPEFTPVPENLKALSPLCAFVQSGKTRVIFYTEHEPTSYRPRVYQWVASAREWRAIETIMDRTTNTVSASLDSQRGVIGVFVDRRDAYEGVASWYRHKRYPSGAATNIYPIGTKLRVTNLDTNKSTIVTITSTWTNTNKQRIIDLVSTAFEEIGNLRAGLIPVRIERI